MRRDTDTKKQEQGFNVAFEIWLIKYFFFLTSKNQNQRLQGATQQQTNEKMKKKK
jgi:hypothetical protein